ncbi:MAG: hypothetical protein IKV43_00200, partial [Clostridia bacterium]|nr:hypothetical protein [Clostridia bacterium]
VIRTQVCIANFRATSPQARPPVRFQNLSVGQANKNRPSEVFSFAFFKFFGLFAKSRPKSVSRQPSPSQKQGKIPYAVRKNRIFQSHQKCPKSVKFHAVF